MNSLLQTVKRAQVDWRMVLMSSVLVAIAVVFNIFSDGIFLSPENLYNIAQQTAVVGILATVMVLVIVARHIDLSVGSVMGFVGVLIAFLMYTANWSWQAACLVGLGAAVVVSLYQSQYICSMYQQQSNPVMDATIRKGRLRFGDKVEIFPLSGYVPLTHDPAQWAYHLLLPWFTLAVLYIGVYSQVLRSSNSICSGLIFLTHKS